MSYLEYESKGDIMIQSDKEFFEGVAKLAEQIKGIADNVFPVYKAFTEDVVFERITDITEIELTLDYMLTYCFDDRILALYKKILRKFYKSYPHMVKSHVDAYYEMYVYEGDDSE